MTKFIAFVFLACMLSASYALMILPPIVYDAKDNKISDSCLTQLEKYNKMVNDCVDDSCKDTFTDVFIEEARKGCIEGEIEKKMFEQIESSYLFNSVSELEVDGVKCSLYSVNLGQSIESRCACMKKMIEFLEKYTSEHQNSILTDSINEFKEEISVSC